MMIRLLKPKRNDKTIQVSQVDQGSIDSKAYNSEAKEIRKQRDLLESLDQLNSEFTEFEKIREGLRVKITSLTQLAPRLTEGRTCLIKEIDETENEMQELNRELYSLNQLRETFLQNILKKQEQKSLLEKQIHLEQNKVKEFKRRVTKLTKETKKIEKATQQKLDKIAQIDKQINQIQSIQNS